MPWNKYGTKIEFICEWRTGKYSLRENYKAFEISRPTAYKLIDKFENHGIKGLTNKHSGQKNQPFSTRQNQKKILN
jgi:transposase